VIKDYLRDWALIDLRVFREWATDHRVNNADLIDNRDGTYGRAFDLRLAPPEMLVKVSETMELALTAGMNAVDHLPSGPPRLTRHPPCLQELVARFGGYDRIPPEAWVEWDRQQKEWSERHRFNENVI
jgi:hypothetical protein